MSEVITLDEAAVKQVFAEAKDQADYLIGLYKLVFPEWDRIVAIAGWPSVNDFTWKAIARLAMDHDQQHAANVLPGGAWMNQGFSTSCGEKLGNWQVSMRSVTRIAYVRSEEAVHETA